MDGFRLGANFDLEKLAGEFSSAKPFEHVNIFPFLKDEDASLMFDYLEELEYYVEDHDLYQFLRSGDFKNEESGKIRMIREFFLKDEIMSIVEKISGVKIRRGVIDIHSLSLLRTHYLLCHDDRVEGRAIAFILNLSRDWKEEDGGALELFDVDEKGNPRNIIKKIVPKFNQFSMFLVSDRSFHQISEVLALDKERITVGGWYYEDK